MKKEILVPILKHSHNKLTARISCPSAVPQSRKNQSVSRSKMHAAAILETRNGRTADNYPNQSPLGRGKTCAGVGGRCRGTCEPQPLHHLREEKVAQACLLGPLSTLFSNLVILGFLRKSFISQARRPRHWDNDRGLNISYRR